MKKKVIFDVVFIVLLTIGITLLYELGCSEVSIKYLFPPLLAIYFIGRYVTLLANKKKA